MLLFHLCGNYQMNHRASEQNVLQVPVQLSWIDQNKVTLKKKSTVIQEDTLLPQLYFLETVDKGNRQRAPFPMKNSSLPLGRGAIKPGERRVYYLRKKKYRTVGCWVSLSTSALTVMAGFLSVRHGHSCSCASHNV